MWQTIFAVHSLVFSRSRSLKGEDNKLKAVLKNELYYLKVTTAQRRLLVQPLPKVDYEVEVVKKGRNVLKL